MKEFHLYMDGNYPIGTLTNHTDTKEVTDRLEQFTHAIIQTTQVHHATTDVLSNGFRLFVHFSEDDVTEIVLGDGNERTDRHIRYAHNLPRMILAGSFSKD